MNETDYRFMKLALREARKGQGRTSPNPCVGAVVVKKGRLVAKGYHRRAGAAHAEVNALRAAGEGAKGATLYVTLEPCNHTGRTPPCTRAILESGIARLVVGMSDPNPQVAGNGCDFLAGQGLSVSRGILEEECRSINRPFLKHVTTGMPWVIMKAGMSLDGRIATGTGQSAWITNELSRRQVHRIRDKVDAILVGIGTALADDPSLTARLPAGRGHDPLRVVLDTHARLAPAARMLAQESSAPTWLFCGPQADAAKVLALEQGGAMVKRAPLAGQGLDLEAVLKELGRAGVNSVLVEGGSRVHGAFLRAALTDEVRLFVAPLFIGADGIPLVDDLGVKVVHQARRFRTVRTRRFADDIMIEGLFEGP